jgi:zinc protease
MATDKTSPSRDVLPFKATEKTLPNGLKVIVVPTGFPNLVSLQIPVQTGSRNEVEPGKSGFAHFFEHMMFRGTKEYPPEKYQEIINRAGARQNAYTTDDYTNYHVTFAKEDLETVLKLEADRFQHLDYPIESFKTEARAVLGEYNKNSASPITKLIEVQHDHAYSVHTYKHTTMGFIADIENMPNQFDYSKQFFERWYRPEYATVIVAGDVDAKQVLPLVEKYFGSWKKGNFKVDVPQEPPAKGPVYANVPWSASTLPYVTVAFHGPGFSDDPKQLDYVAIDTAMDLYFGPTSDLYKQLVQQEQKVDQLFADGVDTIDPGLLTVIARVKNPADAIYVRDQIMKTAARVRTELVDEKRLADFKSNARYGFIRTLDNTEQIASTLARYVRYRRSYDTLNRIYHLYDLLGPSDLQAAAKRYFTDANMVVTTLAKDPLPAGIEKLPTLSSFDASASASATKFETVVQKNALPQLRVKLQFNAGSAYDPKGKDGLAALAAQMITDAGSKAMTLSELKRAFYPMAGGVHARVDKEMVTFTFSVHRDNWKPFFELALPMLLEPGYRAEDFQRIKESQRNALTQDLRGNNEEELGKERLQQLVFAGTPYGHPVLGSVAGIDAITLDDVKAFIASNYVRANLTIGLAGDLPDAFVNELESQLATLPEGSKPKLEPINGNKPQGLQIEIIEKETRATAISFGLPIEVNRSHPDFAALWLARAWLGEHRSSLSHLYQRIREIRGMNYGDYAYVEAFPRGMFQFMPDPNVARQKQLFEVWIRPVVPDNGPMALRIALYELNKLIEQGLAKQQFEDTRDYLMKNVFVMTVTQDQQLGYALDSKWYGIDEFTRYMRDQLSKLTVEQVNAALKRHLSAKDLQVVIITKDAKGLKDKLVSDAYTPVHYDADKPKELLAEDELIGSIKLGIKPERVTITPVEQVFAK